ncbi:RDD family protein [Flavobacterium sp.]|uniref:RDD family protein n=1 Tax=Flavobacterium sp. TaxID=239 RepID=UPI00261543CF|nr:RDD family protein [Flavobacterium sp.]
MENKTFEVTEDLFATQGQRFVNFTIDMIMRYVIIFGIGLIIAIIAKITDNYEIVLWMTSIGQFEEYLLGFIILLIYYTTMETLLSRSIGKYITKTIVVMGDGSKPDLGTIFKRTLCRFIPFDGLSYFGGDHRGWHDSISDTYVVNKELFDAKKELFFAFDEIGTNQE